MNIGSFSAAYAAPVKPVHFGDSPRWEQLLRNWVLAIDRGYIREGEWLTPAQYKEKFRVTGKPIPYDIAEIKNHFDRLVGDDYLEKNHHDQYHLTPEGTRLGTSLLSAKGVELRKAAFI